MGYFLLMLEIWPTHFSNLFFIKHLRKVWVCPFLCSWVISNHNCSEVVGSGSYRFFFNCTLYFYCTFGSVMLTLNIPVEKGWKSLIYEKQLCMWYQKCYLAFSTMNSLPFAYAYRVWTALLLNKQTPMSQYCCIYFGKVQFGVFNYKMIYYEPK